MAFWIARFLIFCMAKILYRHRVYGKEHFPKGTGGIIASNHSSFLDPLLVGASCPEGVYFLARYSLFNLKILNWLLPRLHTHPVAKGKGNIETFKKTAQLVEKGKKVVIFPEGTRSLTGELQPGLPGVGLLVLRTKASVVPVYTFGTFEIWSGKERFPKMHGKTACIIGSPLDFSHLINTDKKEAQVLIVNEIMERIGSLKAWYDRGHKGSPP